MRIWHDPELGRPIAAPLERCAQLLGLDLATIREAAANVEPYLRADGAKVWSLMQLESEVEGLEHAPRLVQCWSRPVGRSCWGVGRPRWWRR